MAACSTAPTASSSPRRSSSTSSGTRGPETIPAKGARRLPPFCHGGQRAEACRDRPRRRRSHRCRRRHCGRGRISAPGRARWRLRGAHLAHQAEIDIDRKDLRDLPALVHDIACRVGDQRTADAAGIEPVHVDHVAGEHHCRGLHDGQLRLAVGRAREDRMEGALPRPAEGQRARPFPGNQIS